MLTFKRKPWTLTLLVSLILAISFASVVEAGEFERRDHDVFRRMVKKRSPQGLSALGLGGANDTPVGAAQDPAEQLSAEPSASPPVLSVPPLPSVEPSLIPSISLGLSSESSAPASDSVSQSESQPASQSVAPSSPPPAASTPTPPPSNPTPEPQPPAQGQPSEPGQKGPSTVLHYETMPAAQQSQPPEKSGNTSAARVSMTVIGVIAGVVGAVIVAWTIFRKWKLARSKKFDERLNPIDWQPPSADDGGIPGARRHSTASSFHSGSGHSINRGYGSTMNHNGPLPDHDFTAGASLAPGGGYTDMSRGPSPQPQMMETNMYGTGYGHHDQYGGVPLHHQGYGGPNYYNGNRPY